jgi:hypothetical protein
MHGLIPRHHRKAGSGPPATALIAWISADPHLRNAVTRTKSHRRETTLPLPATTHLAKAAVAACFVLAFSAVLDITTNMSDGLVLSPLPSGSNISNVLSQGTTDIRNQAVSPTPPQSAEQNSAISATPTTTASVVASAEQPQPVPPVPKPSAHPAPDHPGQPGGYVTSSTASPPAHPVTPRRTGKTGNSDKPGKPGAINMPAEPASPSDISISAEIARLLHPGSPANGSLRAG